MREKVIFKKIGTIIKELSDQYEYLQLSENNLNDLELELFVANANFLTDHIEIMCKLYLQKGAQTEIPGKKEPKFFEPSMQQASYDLPPEEEKKTIPVTNSVSERKNTDKEISKTSEILLTGTSKPADFKAEQPQVKDFGPPHTENTPGMTDKPKENEIFTINQKISSQLAEKEKVNSHTDQLAGPPISDLKQGITMNDKLLYVRDLFNGYNLAYSEAIEILNRFTSFEEASRFLKTNYIAKNNWESKPDTTEKFYALLKRRYA